MALSTKLIPVFSPAYLPSVEYFAYIIKCKEVLFALNFRYQKQTLRNRTYIYGANGKLRLVIPIQHSRKTDGKLFCKTHVCNDFRWQDNHWKSICIAYRSSPFFEYYEDYFYPFFHKEVTNLYWFNIELIATIYQLLGLEFNYKSIYLTGSQYDTMELLLDDKRNNTFLQEKYHQVFENKHGFIKNLSVLDVLFNLGMYSYNYLWELHT